MFKNIITNIFALGFGLTLINLVNAQTQLKLSDEGVAPYVVPGKRLAELRSKSGDLVQIHLDTAPSSKTFVITEVTQEKDGTLNALTVYRVPFGGLQALKEGAGSDVEIEDNDYFGGKVVTLTLVCAGTNQACIEEERIDTGTGKVEAKKMSTFAKANFPKEAEVDARAVLTELLTSRK